MHPPQNGYCSRFEDSNQNMLTFTIRLKAQIFHHHKVFRIGFQQPGALRFTVEVSEIIKLNHFVALMSSATASQAIPSHVR